MPYVLQVLIFPNPDSQTFGCFLLVDMVLTRPWNMLGALGEAEEHVQSIRIA